MASLFFNRDTKVYATDGVGIWEIPVLDGFSFSQATNANEVTLNEMTNASGVSRRSRQMFTDSFAPAEWSFSTYIRPFKSAGTNSVGNANRNSATNHHMVDECMWAWFTGKPTYTATAAGTSSAWSTGWTLGTSSSTLSNAGSNRVDLKTFDLYFVLGAKDDTDPSGPTGPQYTDGNTLIYKLQGAVANEASIDVDIDGIATVQWSGFASIISEQAAFDARLAIIEGTADTDNFIRNRLTALTATSSISGSSKSYGLTLTGANMTFSNNIQFLTPNTLGSVNQPIGHVTGTRSIQGSFNCYIDETANGSADLFADIIGATTTVTNSFDLDFFVGGETGSSDLTPPGMKVSFPTAHIELPVHSIEDVVSLETTFHALPSAIGTPDEFDLTIEGPA
jgi:hypothetical protein